MSDDDIDTLETLNVDASRFDIGYFKTIAWIDFKTNPRYFYFLFSKYGTPVKHTYKDPDNVIPETILVAPSTFKFWIHYKNDISKDAIVFVIYNEQKGCYMTYNEACDVFTP